MAPYNRKHIHENSGKAGAMARGGGAFSDEEIQLLRGLPAVANVTRNRITYADSFKQVCTIRYLTGESPTKIFREAGLPPDLIGYKRIERCVDRWKTSAIKSVTGSGNMSDSEIIAQLVNRYEHAFVMRRNLDSITNRTMEHIPVKAQGDDGIDRGNREHHHQTAGTPYRRTGARERRTARANRRHRLTQTIVMPYASEKVAVNLVNLPYIGEIGRQGGMARRKYGNKVVGWARLTTNGMRQCRKICVHAQKQSFGGRNVRFAG